MPTIRLRMIGSREDADTLIATLHGVDGIERVEEIDDLAPRMRDDSSSADLIDDNEGQAYFVEIEAEDDLHAEAVRAVAELEAEWLGIALEFVEEP